MKTTFMAQPEMCITCKHLIPQEIWETAKTPEGHRICLGCKNPCGLDTQGHVNHQQCPDACYIETLWTDILKYVSGTQIRKDFKA